MLSTEYPCVYGSLPGSFEEFVRLVPSRNRRNVLRQGDRQLRAVYDNVTYEECAHEDQIDEFIDWLARLNIGRRQREGTVSTWAEPETVACRKEIAKAFLARGWLRLEMLRCNNEPIAARMGFAYKGTYFAYNQGFREDHAGFRPGHLLIARRIALSISEGVRAFSFGPGDRTYKREYFAEAAPELALTILPQGGRARVTETGMLFLRSLKRWRGEPV